MKSRHPSSVSWLFSLDKSTKGMAEFSLFSFSQVADSQEVKLGQNGCVLVRRSLREPSHSSHVLEVRPSRDGYSIFVCWKI